jgi:tetratricopeptide (TPR) repeat protein
LIEGQLMPLRYLVGPVTPSRAANWQAHRDQGRCLTFHAGAGADLVLAPTDTWETLLTRLPAHWRPDFIVLDLGYTTIPVCLWDAPVPLAALAPDAQLQWHFFRRFLPLCQLVLTDTAAVQAMHRLGITEATQANHFGLQDVFARPVPASSERRTIDVLFVGNLHPAVQRQRLQWLGRLARLGGRWNVHITQGVHGEDYRRLLLRSRIVFNHSVRGEWNLRVGEACSCGALLFTESDNLEMPGAWKHGEDCVFYDEDNLEALLEHYLTDEDQRAGVAESGRRKAETFTFAAMWEDVVARIEEEWPLIQQRHAQRPHLDPRAKLLARTWQAMGAADGGDPSLPADLDAALAEQPEPALHNARGMVESLQRRDASRRYTPESLQSIAAHFHRAASLPLSASGRGPGGGVLQSPGGEVAALNFIEALATSGHQQLAIEGAQRLLGRLYGAPPPVHEWDLPHFPPTYDFFRVEWERAAWQHAGSPSREQQAKLALLRWRLHSLLGDSTHDLVHRHEAALARPDLPPTRAALGCALGEAKRPQEAVPHLQYAVEQNPFDRSAARALYQALIDAGKPAEAEAYRQERLLLRRAAPSVVRADDWLIQQPAAPHAPLDQAFRSIAQQDSAVGRGLPPDVPIIVGKGRVSLCIIVKNEEANIGACLDCAADICDEVIVLDTGSTDRTRDIARDKGAKVFDFPWIDHFAAARNACLEHATGDWIFWLDADDRLDEANRDKLRRLFVSLPAGNVAYSMKCHCLPDPHSRTATTVDHIRLFRNHPRIRWRYRVHEQILGAVRESGGEVLWADIVIQHTGYTDAALRRRKSARDLRLLEMERRDQPHDPFTLFNLGASYAEMGRYEEALPLLHESLDRSHPRDSIVRKLYALIANCHLHRGRIDEALRVCLQGQAVCPDDEELLFLEGLLRTEKGDFHGARIPLVRLLGTESEQHFASVADGLRGHRGRHQLAVVCCRLGENNEAEQLWHDVLRDRPDYLHARIGLGEMYLAQHRWAELEEQAIALNKLPQGELDAVLLRAKMRMARREFGPARALLEETLSSRPDCLPLLVTLSHVLLREDRDHTTAERVLLEILARDPAHAQARQNLEVLRGRGRT